MINNEKPRDTDMSLNIKCILVHPYEVFCSTSPFYG